MYIVRLTTQEYTAMLSVLIDHSLREDATKEWINVATDDTTTIDDLLHVVATADSR